MDIYGDKILLEVKFHNVKSDRAADSAALQGVISKKPPDWAVLSSASRQEGCSVFG